MCSEYLPPTFAPAHEPRLGAYPPQLPKHRQITRSCINGSCLGSKHWLCNHCHLANPSQIVCPWCRAWITKLYAAQYVSRSPEGLTPVLLCLLLQVLKDIASVVSPDAVPAGHDLKFLLKLDDNDTPTIIKADACKLFEACEQRPQPKAICPNIYRWV